MDYSRFIFRAEVDWLEFEIETETATNFQSLKRHFDFIDFAKPITGLKNNTATNYRLRFQDVKSWGWVAELLSQINSSYPFKNPPIITAVEVAFCARSNGATREELCALTSHFYTAATKYANDNHRFAGTATERTEGLGLAQNIKRRIAEGRTINIGSNGSSPAYPADPLSQRIYFKQTDRGESLPIDQYMAKTEITMQLDALPFRTLEIASTYKFTELSEWFKFRTPNNELTGLMATIAQTQPRAGEKKVRRRAEGGTRLYPKYSEADILLNRRAYDALRRLTVRMSS